MNNYEVLLEKIVSSNFLESGLFKLHYTSDKFIHRIINGLCLIIRKCFYEDGVPRNRKVDFGNKIIFFLIQGDSAVNGPLNKTVHFV